MKALFQLGRKIRNNDLIDLLLSFFPWGLYFVITAWTQASLEVATLAALAAVLIVGYQNLRKKFIIDWCTAFYFGLLAILYLFPIKIWLEQFAFLLSNAAIAAIMWFSILIRRPFTIQYALEQVDPIAAVTPTFRFINYAISTVWAIVTTLLTVGNVLQYTRMVTANNVVNAIHIALLIFAVWFTRWFPDKYQGYLFRKESKKTENIADNEYLNGNYASVHDELSVTNLPVVGVLPNDLVGIYMRNGPNPAFPPISYTYPIDGDGMIHAIYLEEGKASYRNRFVETKGLLAEKKAGRALYGGIANPITVDPALVGKKGDQGPIKDGAFIHIIRHAKQYIALWESGPAYAMTAQLQTLGEWCPRSANSPFAVNAHTRLDPKTGHLFAFTYDFLEPYLRYYVLNKEGELIKNVPVNKSYSSMIHDFVLTENHVIFFDCPAIFDLKRLAKSENMLAWEPELGVNIIVVNRNDNTVFSIKTEPFFVYHFANAYEQEGKIIIHYVRHEKLFLAGTATKTPYLCRTIIDLQTKTVVHQPLSDYLVEFPRINDHFTTQNNRYIYLPAKTASKEFNALIKYDTEKQTAIVHDFGKQAEIDEAVFAPSHTRHEEDEGYMMLFVYDRNENSSEFVILQAQDFTSEPIARVKLPRRVPHGLHGSWMPNN